MADISIFVWGSTFLLTLIAVSWLWFRKVRIPHVLSVLQLLLYTTASAAITHQALVAELSLPNSTQYNSWPDLGLLYLAIHYFLVFWLVFGYARPSRFNFLAIWSILLLYSSYLYVRTFFAPEYGIPYPFLYSVALVQMLGLRVRSNSNTSPAQSQDRFRTFSPALLISLSAFLLISGISTVLSAAPSESLNQYIQIVCFAFLPFLFARHVADRNIWLVAGMWIIILGGLIWVVLAAIKFCLIVVDLGLIQALSYRLYISDVGPNWITYPMTILLPLCIGFGLTTQGQRRKQAWWIGCAGMLLTLSYAQSNVGYSGWIGLLLGTATMVLLIKWPALNIKWKNYPQLQLAIICAVSSLVVTIILVGVGFASRVNSISFYTRLYGWRTLLYQVADYPLFGSGLGVRHVTARYGDQVSWDDIGTASSWLVQEPLNQWTKQFQLRYHTHNLFLEVAVGTGMLGLLAFLWFLWELAKHSLIVLHFASGASRILIAGCIAGVVASLGWGFIDVMEYSPIFFTTPVWLLIGLLIAAPRAFNLQIGNEKFQITDRTMSTLSVKFKAIPFTFCLIIAIIAINLPIIGNFHYRVAYAAFQEYRWATAAEELSRALKWEPLNAKYFQLRAEAFINLGRFDNAIAIYERAIQLKRDFAPYHSQLGWLFWLQGDLEKATFHFQKAVEMDPIEAWRGGLHTHLALAYIAQGYIEDAMPLLQKSIELDPEMRLSPVTIWVPLQGKDGKYDVVVDPVYFASANGERVSETLEERIQAQLGRADYTVRQFTIDLDTLLPSNTISLNQILDAVMADYLASQVNNHLEAPQQLATVAEVARKVELNTRAEQAYLLYQNSFPTSEYGFRELGTFFHDHARLAEAQTMLERATQIRPDDPDSWSALTEVYINRELQDAAMSALDMLHSLAPLDPRLNELRAQVFLQEGELAYAMENLRKSLVITESIPNRLKLVSLYRQFEEQKWADEQCLKATDALHRSVPRPLDPQLWNISVCLAQSNLRIKDIKNLNICSRSTNLQICEILLGHIYRARGEFEQALISYKDASDIQPDDNGSHYFLGHTYLALGKLQEAEDEFIRSAELNSTESLPLLSLGQLQWGQGRKEAAIQSFSAAVLATPGWGEIQTVLGNALLAIGDKPGAAVSYQLAQIADGDLGEGKIYDFAAHLADANIQSPNPDYVKNDYFTINTQYSHSNGERQRVLFMHPNSSVSYTITVPASSTLQFTLALSPDSWTQAGDGVNFSVNIQTRQGTQLLYSSYIDPKNYIADQRLSLPTVIDLSAYTGQTVTIIFITGCGPVEDCEFDWAGWGEPAIMLTK